VKVRRDLRGHAANALGIAFSVGGAGGPGLAGLYVLGRPPIPRPLEAQGAARSADILCLVCPQGRRRLHPPQQPRLRPGLRPGLHRPRKVPGPKAASTAVSVKRDGQPRANLSLEVAPNGEAQGGRNGTQTRGMVERMASDQPVVAGPLARGCPGPGGRLGMAEPPAPGQLAL
jgi:hypothetical protein